VLGSAGAQTVSFRLRHKDGRWLWVETSCRGIRVSGSDRVSEIHCVTRDIGERKRAQAELERRLAQQSAVTVEVVEQDALFDALPVDTCGEGGRRLTELPVQATTG
jgi:PAS domain-containing protein